MLMSSKSPWTWQLFSLRLTSISMAPSKSSSRMWILSGRMPWSITQIGTPQVNPVWWIQRSPHVKCAHLFTQLCSGPRSPDPPQGVCAERCGPCHHQSWTGWRFWEDLWGDQSVTPNKRYIMCVYVYVASRFSIVLRFLLACNFTIGKKCISKCISEEKSEYKRQWCHWYYIITAVPAPYLPYGWW